MKINIKGTIIRNDYKRAYDFFKIENTCPNDVSAALENAKGELIDVYINSGGGEITSASEIYAMLTAYRNIKIHVVGMAASAASVIMCAGDCDISPTSMVMIHNVSSWAEGDYNTMSHESQVLLTATKAMAAAYVAKTGKSENDFLKLMNEEKWFTAKEAVEIGLCDRIANVPETQLVNAWCTMLTSQQISEYQNAIQIAKSKLKLLEVKNHETEIS